MHRKENASKNRLNSCLLQSHFHSCVRSLPEMSMATAAPCDKTVFTGSSTDSSSDEPELTAQMIAQLKHELICLPDAGNGYTLSVGPAFEAQFGRAHPRSPLVVGQGGDNLLSTSASGKSFVGRYLLEGEGEGESEGVGG
jgi:hypothetical protein